MLPSCQHLQLEKVKVQEEIINTQVEKERMKVREARWEYFQATFDRDRLGTRFCHLDINYGSLQLKCTHLPRPLRLTATAPKCNAVSWQLGQKNWRLPPPRPTSTKGPTTKTSGTCK